ncbi:MAG TPA: hypothetical protein VMW03_08535 [Candidatus Krumholzibacteriaceae bacterium]|nr:hypothetical protein [Candidatus Krumholzibacteriaceae bacterium]
MRRVPWAAAVFLVAVIAVSVLYLEPGPPIEADLYRAVWRRDIEFPSPNVHDPPEEGRVNLIEWFAVARGVQMLLDSGELPYLEGVYVTRTGSMGQRTYASPRCAPRPLSLFLTGSTPTCTAT